MKIKTNNKFRDYEFIKKVIQSCNHYSQTIACLKLINIFTSKYGCVENQKISPLYQSLQVEYSSIRHKLGLESNNPLR